MLLSDLVSALLLLTRLPVARFGASPNLARCVWAFPVVGLIVNGIGALVYWAAHGAGMPPLLSAALALAAMMLVTGAFHEDGLADTADGFGGGSAPTQKLEIMRDPRIGSYGAVALTLSIIVRVAAVAGIDQPGKVVAALIVAGVLGRSGTALLPLTLAPARSGGMGAAIGTPRTMSVAAGFGLATALALLLLRVRLAAAVMVLALAVAAGIAKLARAQIGGYTGDVLGATEVAIECAVLSVLAAAFTP